MRLNGMLLVTPVLAMGLLLSGCGDDNAAAPGGDGGGAVAGDTIPAAMQAFADNGEVVEIEIAGDDRMQFDRDRLTVPAGAMVRLTLQHTGQLPAQSMGHNVVILKDSGADPFDFGADVSEQGGTLDNDYVPTEMRDRVLAFTPIIGGSQTTHVEFKAPDTPGEHPFLCSFPGHAGMMNGIFEVQ